MNDEPENSDGETWWTEAAIVLVIVVGWLLLEIFVFPNDVPWPLIK